MNRRGRTPKPVQPLEAVRNAIHALPEKPTERSSVIVLGRTIKAWGSHFRRQGVKWTDIVGPRYSVADVICKWCGQAASRKDKGRRYCSHECRTLAEAAKKEANRIPRLIRRLNNQFRSRLRKLARSLPTWENWARSNVACKPHYGKTWAAKCASMARVNRHRKAIRRTIERQPKCSTWEEACSMMLKNGNAKARETPWQRKAINMASNSRKRMTMRALRLAAYSE